MRPNNDTSAGCEPALGCSEGLLICSCLLCLLLHGGLSDKAVDVSGVCNLTNNTLDLLPDASNGRRSALVRQSTIGAGSELSDSALHKGALRVAHSEEDGVDAKENPGAFGEGDSGEDEAEEEENLEDGDERHAAVIVLLDEASNGLGEAGGLRLSALTGGLRLAMNGRKQHGARVGGDVEDGIHSKGHDGQRNAP